MSAWQQFTLAFTTATDNGGAYYMVDEATGRLTLSVRARYLRQYFKHVRAGAVRVGAVGTVTFDPVAFRNPNGGFVVVVRATGAGTFTIGGLPGGRYGGAYTLGATDSSVTTYDAQVPDQTITAGQDVTVTIPAKGIVTIYARIGAGPPPPPNVRIVR